MNHLEESQILAIRDGESVPAEARAHAATCATCAAAVESAVQRAATIDDVLSALDRPVEPTAARAGVRARLKSEPSASEGHRWSGWHLGRAAALLLLSAGAAAALPGSPIRNILIPSRSAPPAPLVTAPAEVLPVEPLTTYAVDASAGIAASMRRSNGTKTAPPGRYVCRSPASVHREFSALSVPGQS